jgi:hypothetical protein
MLKWNSVMAFTVRSLLLPFAGDATSCQRTFRFHGESPSWKEIFDMLERITGVKYKVTYQSVDEAWKLQTEAKENSDDKLEMSASHRIVQGTEGTLLPKPYDNEKFPDVKVKGVEEALKHMFSDEKLRRFLGL